jgi:hypothetical protein
VNQQKHSSHTEQEERAGIAPGYQYPSGWDDPCRVAPKEYSVQLANPETAGSDRQHSEYDLEMLLF